MPKAATAGKRSADKLHLERFVPYRLALLSNTVSMSIAHAFDRDFSLSIAEWRVIAVLARSPDLSAMEVAEQTALDKVGVSRVVGRLTAARLLVRSLHRGDRRRSVLRLSARGMSVYTRVAPRALRYEQKLLAALSATERRTLDRLISRLTHRAREMKPRNGGDDAGK